MAIFNPQVPGGSADQNAYFKWSEPTKDIKADTSTGQVLATVGEGIEGTAKLADQTVKDQIKTDVYSKVDTERDNFTSALNQVKASVVPAAVQTPAGSSVLSLTDENAPAAPVPAAIDIGLNKVDAVQSALVNGKINDTYYTQRLNSIAKDMRTQYPGYREYIDQRISEATGVNPANAYIKNLMEDINRQGVKKDVEKDKTETMLRKALENHVPNADIFLEGFRNGTIPQGRAEEFVYRGMSEKDGIDLANSRRALSNGNREDIATQRTQDFTGEVGASIASNMHALVTIPGVDTPQGITDFMKIVASHPEQYTDAQMRTLDTQIMAQKNVLANQLMARANQTQKDKDGKTYSYATDIGSDKVATTIKNQLAVYDNIHDALTGGGPQGAGLAFWHANQVTARFADAHEKMLNGPLGNDIKTFKILNDDMGPALAGILVPKLIAAGVDTKMAGLFNQSATEARAQPDFDGTGKPITYMDHVRQANQLQADGKINASMKARYQGDLVKIGEDIQDPKMPDVTKVKVVKYLFSPEGQGLLGTFKTDYVNSEGKQVPGKYKVFNALTSDGMVENIAKLSKTDPTIGTMYKNYLENEAGSQLFYKEFQNLNTYTNQYDLHFKYNNGESGGVPRITLIDKQGNELPNPPDRPYPYNQGKDYAYKPIQQNIERINTALAGMSRVEKGFNGDVNSYVLNFLQHAQVNMGKNWTGLPADLADAIAASRAPQKKIDDVFKDIK